MERILNKIGVLENTDTSNFRYQWLIFLKKSTDDHKQIKKLPVEPILTRKYVNIVPSLPDGSRFQTTAV